METVTGAKSLLVRSSCVSLEHSVYLRDGDLMLPPWCLPSRPSGKDRLADGPGLWSVTWMPTQGLCTGMTSSFLPGLEFALFSQSGNKFSPVLVQPALET